MEAGIQSVLYGDIIGFIDLAPVLSRSIQKEHPFDLAIAAQFEERSQFSAAVLKNQSILLSILNKTIKSISPEERKAILSKNFTVVYKKTTDYNLLIKVIVIFLIFIFLASHRHLTLLRYNKEHKSILSLIDNHILMLQTTSEGIITETSHAFCLQLSYKKEQLIGKHFSRIYHIPDSDLTPMDLKKHLDSNEFWEKDLLIISKFGDRLWFNVKITKNQIEHFKHSKFSVIFHDIRNQKQIEKVSQTDALTQIPNRLFLDHLFDKELDRSARYQTIFSIIIVDIDHFKSFNDEYGHQVGDEVLISIAETIAKGIRTVDSVGRWGGEEFLIICPETNSKDAKKVAEKVRVMIEKTPFKHNKVLTCSFGVAQYMPGNNNRNSLFEKADKALYKAKATGRNKVVTNDS
jgi:diguanylate cyclase (GGDEF)-like protein/PAS domain S-box-containing protein